MPLILDKNIDRLSQGKYVELTDILVEIPRNQGIFDQLGVFEDVYVTQKKIEIQRSTWANHLVKDKNWDEKPDTLVSRPVRGFIQASIPNRQLLDAIKPQDIDGVAKVDTMMDAWGLEEVADIRTEKLAVLNGAFDDTQEAARMHLLKTGEVLAPAGTLATSYGDTINFYNEMGVTRQTVNIPLTGAADPRNAISGLTRDMKLALRNAPTRGGYRELVVLAGTNLFNAVVTNPFVTEVTKYYNQELSRLLTGVAPQATGYDTYFQQVVIWGVRFIDVGAGGYTSPDGTFTQWIDDDAGIALPTGVRGMFKTYYAPANKFSSVNKRASGRYYWEKLNDEDDLIQMKVESNFMDGLLYPQAVFDITFS